MTVEPPDGKDLRAEDVKPYRYVFSSRFAFSITAMIGLCLFYTMRADMSVGILCMVNHTAIRAMEETFSENRSLETQPKASSFTPSCKNNNPFASSVNGTKNEDGPFVWDSFIQNQILAAFFYGYPVLQIASGYFGASIGGRWIVFAAMLVLAIFTILMPFIANDWIVVVVFRAIQGVASGAVVPALRGILGQWSPPNERTRLTTLVSSGIQLGNILTFSLAGVMCQYVSSQFIFFFWGGLTFTWLVMWFFFGYEKPSDHPRIAEAEKIYITKALGPEITGKKTVIKLSSVPWLEFAKSPPVWGVVIANFASDWGGYTFLSQTPRYLKSVHNFDIQANALLSSIPYIGFWVIIVVAGCIADLVRERKWLSTIWTRRIFTATGFLIPSGLLILLGYLSCEYWLEAVVVLFFIISTTGIQYSGWDVTLYDIAPKYSGIIWGISNTIASFSGIATNLIAAASMSPNPTLSEWRTLFFITSGVMACGSIMYCLLTRADVQPWAMDEEDAKDNAKDAEKIIESSSASPVTSVTSLDEIEYF